MAGVASLPMYWRAENADAWRAMWRDVQAAARAQVLTLPDLLAPAAIPDPWTDHWLQDDLLLSQTCSMPLRTALRHQVTYVGTFDFGLGDAPGFYHSVLRTRTQDGPIRALAINGYDSQSGYVAGLEPLDGADDTSAYAARCPEIRVTGSHAASLKAVADGAADACYVDAVTARLCDRFDPWAKETVTRGKTRQTPGLPLITAKGTDPAPLQQVFRDVFAARPGWLGAADLGGLRDFVVLDEAAYLDLPVPPDAALSPTGDARDG